MSTTTRDVPRGTIEGLRKYWTADLLSGFLVFLIALPLCLGISLACGYPAMAGIFTAIIGGVLSAFISDSELTIKGPAAGLIVIAIGCVTDFGFTAGRDPEADFRAYQLALGVGVAAGVIQILFGLFRAGVLGEFFPAAAVHGLLASIGVIIIAKQLPVTLGLSSEGAPLELLAKIPEFIMNMNPVIALIGAISLIVMFGHPLLKIPLLKKIPAPMIVLLIAVPMGMYFEVSRAQTYSYGSGVFELGPQFLVDVPLNMFSAIAFPDFSGVATSTGVKYIILFALIGSLESLLSSKAIDQIDPWKRKTNQDRDLLAVGIANTAAAFVGGLPMISEIVRSKANIDNGAKTRFANMFHGLCLLAFVALLPALINQIPLAALGAMLVFTGFRLASPKEFVHMYHVGREQLVIFVATIIGVLATDLLVGIGIGIVVRVLLHFTNSVPVASLLRLNARVERQGAQSATITIKESAVFSTWIGLKKRLESVRDCKQVLLDLSDTRVVDHTVMHNLSEMEKEFRENDSTLVIQGLESHQKLSDYPTATRIRGAR